MYDSNQILLYKWSPWSVLIHFYCRVYQVRVAMDFDWPWIKTNQRVLSVLLWISVRGCWTEKFEPLVVTLSLEFSRLPEMLSPLKTTLFPVLP